MGENSKIEWTDHTFNPWWGCVKVSPACTHCYAETLAARFGTQWGPHAERRWFLDKHWQDPVKWNRQAEREGVRRRVFCASMADVFEELPADHPDSMRMADERVRLFELIDVTPHLDWLLLTKRPENIRRMWMQPVNAHSYGSAQQFARQSMLMKRFGRIGYHAADKAGYRDNVWLGTTVEDQANADRRIPELLKCRDLSPVLFLSCEPLLGPVDLTRCPEKDKGSWLKVTDVLQGVTWEESFCDGNDGVAVRERHAAVDWVIAGGESGPHARPSHPAWFKSLRDQCAAAGVAFHFKQWGEYSPEQIGNVHYTPMHSGVPMSEPTSMFRVGKKAAGRLLDGRTWDEVPNARP